MFCVRCNIVKIKLVFQLSLNYFKVKLVKPLMEREKKVDSLIERLSNHSPVCNVSLKQGLPFERDIGLLLSTLKTRNLYKLNIDQIYTKLQTIINEIPIYIKHNLLNKYYSHSWISHVSYQFNLTPLSIFVSLLKKYVIRKKFNVLWDIIVLLLKNGAFPLLNPVQNKAINENNKILSLQLIWSLYVNLFNFIDDEQLILQRISFVLSFVDKFEFDTFIINHYNSNRYYFNITKYYPSICHNISTSKEPHIPSPLFLRTLLEFGSFPIFDKNICLNNDNNNNKNDKPYHLSFGKYHQLFFDKKLINFQFAYDSLERDEGFPALIDGIYYIIIGMAFGDKMITKWRYFDNDDNNNNLYIIHDENDNENAYYLYNLFGLNNTEWIKWSFENIWKHKTDKKLFDIINKLNINNLYLNKWSGRIRESSCYFSMDFIAFYFKLCGFQKCLNGKELSLWMKKYENNVEILSLIFKTQKYTKRITNNFVNNKLYIFFWNILCNKTSSDSSIILRLLIKHLVDLSDCDDNINNNFENIYKPLYNDFCDKFNGLNWKIKNNLMTNFIELLEKWKLNGLEIVNTYYGLKCIFNGSSSQIFKTLTNSNHNLLNIQEIQNNNDQTINVIFNIFNERGKYIQQRHKNMMILFGKWLINNGHKQNVMQFIDNLYVETRQITNNDALKQKQSVMIKRFQIEWNLR